MPSAKFTKSQIIQLAIAGLLSILAQVCLLLPKVSREFFQFPEWGSPAAGAILFVSATIWIITILRSQKTGWRGNAHFLFNQTTIVIGVYLLENTFASNIQIGGFLLTSLFTALTIYGIVANTAHLAKSEVIKGESNEAKQDPPRLHDIDKNVGALKEQIKSTTNKLNAEKHRTTQLTYLNELSQQLEAELDPPVAAQLAVNSLERAVKCTFISLMTLETDKNEFVALSSSGSMTNIIPPGHRQNANKGLTGRVNRQKKTIIVNDTSIDPEFIPGNNDNTRSMIVIPLLAQGAVKGVVMVCSDKTHAFNNMDAAIAEGVACELMRAWERSNYNKRLTELIQAGISLTTLLDTQAAVDEVAILSRKTFEAQFVFITLLDQHGNFSRTAYAGNAPRLLNSLTNNPAKEPFLKAALNGIKPFRVRDLRKYVSAKNLDIDSPDLRSALAIPIRLHRLSIGTIIAFGKENGVFYSESDESLADLLASQAAASIESSWLYQELRNQLNISSMLRQLSEDVILTDELNTAAELITRAAYKATNAAETGIVLINANGEIQAAVELDENGFHERQQHPMGTVHQAIESGQSIFESRNNGSLVCYPLLTHKRPVGALWMNIPESRGQDFANIQLLANQAAVSLERSNLLSELRGQAKEIEAAYEELEAAYDLTLNALMSALDARDRETEGHSMRVSKLACLLGEKIGLNGDQLKALERGALLHDIGKIGISDSILHKPGKLTDDEWKIMRMHPDIGARIVDRIPFLQQSMSVVQYHHERWNGSGYPLGIKGADIPILARIFSVVDVFDALTSKRSYRKKSEPDEAMQYLKDESWVLFDGKIVETLAQLPYADHIENKKNT